jgi:HAD superfamily hydrolase (TIGR01509 family)
MGRKYHPEIEDFDKIIKGTTLTQIYANYFPEPELQAEITLQLDEWESGMKYRFVAGAEDFILDLRSHGVKCGIVTSSNEKKMANVRKRIPNLDSLFDKVLTSEMFSASKPDPDCYLLGARVFGVEKSECVVFEDAFTGLEAGMRAGMFTVGLATTNSRDAICDRCHLVADSFSDLSYQRVEDEHRRFLECGV